MTIYLYEFRYGSRLLHGQDIVSSAAAVDPGQILLMSGVELLLNRMAESLYTMTLGERSEDDDLKCFRWINKTTLACAESLLLLWRQYHYTYRERGRRFARMAGERLGFMVDQRAVLLALRGARDRIQASPTARTVS